MGADLQLTGLASGFDWAPVVDQLIELERVPQKRLEREKASNEEKVSDLSLLKSQLDTLNSAGKALQNSDLYNARKIGMDSDSALILTASADPGALTGNYTVSVYSIGTHTEMSSKNRVPGGLGKGLVTATALQDLPVQTAITTGTFTIAGKTFSISNLTMTLQQLMDLVNDVGDANGDNVDGVNAEGDGSGITLEYDSINDRMIVDGGENAISTLGDLPILGSPTDTSNFLQVMRLLNRESFTRDADLESSSGVSIWGTGATASNPNLKSWIHVDDSYEIANNGITSADDRIYAGYDTGSGTTTLYRRIKNEAEYNANLASANYSVGDKVYRNGYVYDAMVATPSVAWSSTLGDASGTTEVVHNGRYWKLMMDLESLRAETGHPSTTSNFKAAVDADAHFGPYTGNANAIKQGDVVKGDDGVFFRAIRDRSANAEDLSATGGSFIALKNANASGAWNSNINGSGNGQFRPNHIYQNGRLFKANESGNFSANKGFVEHAGSTGQIKHTAGDYVIGKDGSTYPNTGQEYDEKAFEASNQWSSVQVLPQASSAHSLWTKDNYFHADTTGDGNGNENFFKSTAKWDEVRTHSPMKNYNPTSNPTTDKFVHTALGTTNFYQAQAAWDNVTDYANSANIDGSFSLGKYVFHTALNEFYKTKIDFNDIIAAAEQKIYNDDAGSIGDKYVKDGANFYQAQALWDNVADYNENSTLSGVTTGLYRKLVSDGLANDRIYKSKIDLDAIENNAHDNKVLYSTGDRVKSGTSYYQALKNTATAATQSFNNTVTSALVEPITAGQRVLDQTNGVVYEATAALQAVTAYANTTNWTTGDIVSNSNKFYKAKSVLANASTPTFASSVTSAQVQSTNAGERILDTSGGAVYEATAALAAIPNYGNTTRWTTNQVVDKGDGTFWKAQQDVASFSFTSAGGISSGDLTGVTTGSLALNSTQGKVYKALQNLGSTPAFNNATATNSNTLVEESGKYFTLLGKFWGTVADGNPIPSGPASENDLVWDATTGTFWKAGNGSDLNNFLKTESVLGANDQWTDTTCSDLSTLEGSFFATDFTNDVLKPTGSNLYWMEETNATDLSANAYWQEETIAKTPSTDGANTYWTPVPAATDLSDSTYWEELTVIETPSSDSTNTYWSVVTGATDVSDTSYWEDVTSKITLSGQDASAGSNDFWEDVTSSVVDFSGGLVGEAANFWTDVTNSVSLTTSLGDAGANDFWERTTKDSDAEKLTDLTNTNWWTDVDATLKNRTNTTWWSDVTTEVNDLGDSNWWTDVTSSFTDPTDVNWWTEVGYADNAARVDTSFWQTVSPEMAVLTLPSYSIWSAAGSYNANDVVKGSDDNFYRFTSGGNSSEDPTAAGQSSWLPAPSKNPSVEDHTIWAEMGNLTAFAGTDGKFGTHDDENHYRSSGAPLYSAWAAGSSHNANDVVKASNNNFYRFKSGGITSQDPTSVSQTSWDLVVDANTYANLRTGAAGLASTQEELALGFQYADTYMWQQNATGIPAPGSGTGWQNYWEALKESVIRSTQALGTIDMTVSLASANFANAFSGTASGLGNFFIGEGEGAVRIDYDINNDTVAALVSRVNASEANVHMYYDPVSDRFVIRNKSTGSIGIVLHESGSYDTLASNAGAGNLLQLMGMAAPSAISDLHGSKIHSNGDYVYVNDGAGKTYWQALQDNPSDTPSPSSTQWRQVILGVGRSMTSEIGENSKVRVNEGDFVYSTDTSFTKTEHGYEGITFDISRAAVNDTATFTIAKDNTRAKSAIDSFVTEFNDAQDYIASLTAVVNDGDSVSSGRFSSNIEISRLGSQLRKVVFGDSSPHSESGTTTDGSNLIINSNDGSNTELNAISTQLNLSASDTGYVVKVLDDNSTGVQKYYEWNGSAWAESDPSFSAFRLSSIGLDFGIGSNRLKVENSALLLQALEDEPEKVEALFAEATVENAFDSNTQTTRKYEGISYALDEFISSFLSGDTNSGYRGAYNTHLESIRAQNKRIDERIESMETYLEQREKTLSDGFMRMEEMQSKMNTQLQTLTNSFKK